MWSEKWELYKKGVIEKELSPHRLAFFKTNPTDEQIMFLDMHEQRRNGAMIVMILLMFSLGIWFGTIVFYWSLTGVL